jgi:hypothetical protein
MPFKYTLRVNRSTPVLIVSLNLSIEGNELWSISPTFYEQICANILVPKKYRKALRETLVQKSTLKMLVKFTPRLPIA